MNNYVIEVPNRKQHRGCYPQNIKFFGKELYWWVGHELILSQSLNKGDFMVKVLVNMVSFLLSIFGVERL